MINKTLFHNDSNRIFFFALVISLLPLNLNGQQIKADSVLLKKNLYFLADDSMMGRAPGTVQDSISAAFISAELSKNGYIPLIGDSNIIPFTFTIHREVLPGSTLTIDGQELEEGKDFRIHPISSAKSVNGEIMVLEAKDLKKLSSNSADSNPMKKIFESKVLLVKLPIDSIQYYTTPVETAGFRALLFNTPELPDFTGKTRSAGVSIPVIWVADSTAQKITNEKRIFSEISSKVSVVKGRTFNIAAIKPGRGNKYILAGAHYDHLGTGGEGSGSMLRSGEGIHNGADDNASGVVSVLETGRVLAQLINTVEAGSMNDYGIAIAAFGAEERGLIGSKLLVDTLISLSKMPAIMINLDMVGRMKDNKLQAGGSGTFTGADSLLRNVNEKFSFDMSVTKDGYGPSDHSSFYTKGVPVLYFTTGVHKEYHTPYDDSHLINYGGLTKVTEYIITIIWEIMNSRFEPEYIKSEAPVSGARRSFKVTLGLIPDFTYEKGDGFRIGSVTDGRPAQNSGLKEGDIIVMMHTKVIKNIYDYMSILESLSKGDTVPVKIIRGGKELNFNIQL